MTSPEPAQPDPRASHRGGAHTPLERAANLAGALLLMAWFVWWVVALVDGRLPYVERLWFRIPFLGSDFWSQVDYAARAFAGGVDPYSDPGHLFHYPPLAFRIFLWSPLLSQSTAVRVWIVVLGVLLVVAAVVALRARSSLGVSRLPLLLGVAVFVFSFPAIFTMERANFDLVSLAVVLLAVPLLHRGPRAEIVAGALLAVAPWMKLYPGVLALALLGLRRPRAFAAFVVAGVGIGLATPSETLSSFRVLSRAMDMAAFNAFTDPFPQWSHSLSLLWVRAAALTQGTEIGGVIYDFPAFLFGLALVLPLLVWVCLRVRRAGSPSAVTLPLLLWVLAAGSYVPIIANDYSLVYLPLVALAVTTRRDPPWISLLTAFLIPWWQPIALPIDSIALFAMKLSALVGVGLAIVRRADELGKREQPPGDAGATAQRAEGLGAAGDLGTGATG